MTSPPSTGANLRTTNPIESSFATVKLRTKITKGHVAGSEEKTATSRSRWRMLVGQVLVLVGA
jgi:hypothetical protein